MKIQDPFNWSIWNLFNHDHKQIAIAGGPDVKYYLDGQWKVERIDTGEVIIRIEGAVEMAAWLNRNEAHEIAA